jgi:hypothetical protein
MLKLNDVLSFSSLFELVQYHRRAPLKTADYEILLRSGVPTVSDHASKPWFFGDSNRNSTEERLYGTPDGTYLVRKSESSTVEAYAISFRALNKTKHCLVRKENRWYVIGELRFDSLTSMVAHYQEKPLFKKVKLKYVLRPSLTVPDLIWVRSCSPLYPFPTLLSLASSFVFKVDLSVFLSCAQVVNEEVRF